MSDGFTLRTAFEDLCIESGWPVARLTFFGPAGNDERVTLWSVADGLESLRDAWQAAGELSSDVARAEGLHWTVAFPIFVDAEVVGAIEACAPNRPRVDGLLRSGRLLGSLLVSQKAA